MSDPTAPPAPPSDPFRDPGGQTADVWRRVSPRLASARLVVLLVPLVVLTVGVVAVTVVVDLPQVGFLVVVVALAVGLWLLWLVGRQVRAVGYCLRADDLLVVSGIAWRRLVIVPYGRMQLVDVTRGPVDRWFGLASVQLHTAAATTDASIPGLTPDDAAQLRDRLAALGEQRSGGL